MSIRQATFDLCKTIPNLPKQAEVRAAIAGLANKQIGYYGERQHAQAFGYLLIDKQRKELAKPPSRLALEPLSDEVRRTLACYLSEVFEMNRLCVQRLSNACANCDAYAVSPYNQFVQINVPPFKQFEFFPANEVQNLVNEFERQPLLQLAIDTSRIFSVTFSPQRYVDELVQLEHAIQAEDVGSVPKLIKDISDLEPLTSSRWMQLQHLSAVLGLRASLGVINQLLYSKLFSSKLPCFDDHNIIKFGTYAFATGGSKLIYQEGGSLFLLMPGEITVATGVPPDDTARYFCRVERLHTSWMPGQPSYVELRTLDENLNPYAILFEPFIRSQKSVANGGD